MSAATREISADEILEALDLSRAQPGAGFLEALFARFNAKVPFENASKIVRDREVADPSEKPRGPDTFWSDHLALGTGGTCFARVAAFDWLLEALGFGSRRVLGRVARDGDHSALMVGTPAGECIVDVGFPLPALLPARAGIVGTPQGDVEVVETARGFGVQYREGVPEGPRELEIFREPVPDERFAAAWRETFRPGSRFLLDVCLRRDLGHRVLSWTAGEIRVDDRHSRLRVPSVAPAAIAELFDVDPSIVSRAFTIAGPPRAGAPAASLSAYLETAAAPPQALAAIASAAGYRRLLDGVAEVVSEEVLPDRFRLRLRPPGSADAAAIEDEVSFDAASARLSVVRRGASGRPFESSYRAIARGGRTYLVREAALDASGEELLRNDSLRGRLAGTLAVDLLAWARMLGGQVSQ
ncbi:MAG TPA: arylamine N-acetyltransferase, partial [Thermoanaerobaculia bacterium]|nr:arylamine N-acetyltransferase [Thermoanaerobaculia bacterium]